MKVLVCGGRDYNNQIYLKKSLDAFHKNNSITKLVSGGAKGADSLAYYWAKDNNIETAVYKADWNKYGKSAGPIRNIEMLDKENPDIVIAFPGGRGTEHMIKVSKERKINVITYYEEG